MSADTLAQICADRRNDVERARLERPLPALRAEAEAAPAPRDFEGALSRAAERDGFGLIAEIKKASPSHGLIRAGFDPAALARSYADGGATCLSVLTETRWFQGADEHLRLAREAAPLPALRKDFVLTPWQVYETRVLGADAMLLILAALTPHEAADLLAIAGALGLCVLVECHDEAEVALAVRLGARLIGVNNRNLRTLRTSLDVTERLAPMIPPDRLVVAESGVATAEDVARVRRAGARAVLVGEALMREPDVAAAARRLRSPAPADGDRS